MSLNKELKEERRAQGLCVYCGRPAVVKRYGKPARRCEKCSGSHVSQKYYARHGVETRSRVTGRPPGKIDSELRKRPEQERVACPECKIRTKAEYWFCPWCGTALPEPKEEN